MAPPNQRDDFPRSSRIPPVGQPGASGDDGDRSHFHRSSAGARDNSGDPDRNRSDPLWGLPDPETSPAFYADVPAKRLVAFVVDSLLIGGITLLLVPFTAFTAIFYLPFLALLVSFAYRSLTLASGSATWGMRLAGIEIRTHRGERLDLATALGHTFLFSLFLGMVLPLLISVLLMLTTARKQGLHDMVLGTAALNRPARR